MKSYLIIFAKEPQEGKVKTRLEGYLSRNRCLELYTAFLNDTLAVANKIKSDAKFIAYTSLNKTPDYLRRNSRRFKLFRQRGRDLGEKMHNASMHVFAGKPAKIVIIGSDSPDLPAEYVEGAFCKLDRCDLVIGPSKDAGYYLIALKKPCLELFRGIEWSTSRVLSDTLTNARRLKKKTALLPKWYDIDTPGDLLLLANRLKSNKREDVAAWTKRSLGI